MTDQDKGGNGKAVKKRGLKKGICRANDTATGRLNLTGRSKSRSRIHERKI
jgi:hypothetical protein